MYAQTRFEVPGWHESKKAAQSYQLQLLQSGLIKRIAYALTHTTKPILITILSLSNSFNEHWNVDTSRSRE